MPGFLVSVLGKRLEWFAMKVNGPMNIPLEIASPQAIRSAGKLDNRKDDS